MNEICDCGREEATINTTSDGWMCGLCFNEKYGRKKSLNSSNP